MYPYPNQGGAYGYSGGYGAGGYGAGGGGNGGRGYGAGGYGAGGNNGRQVTGYNGGGYNANPDTVGQYVEHDQYGRRTEGEFEVWGPSSYPNNDNATGETAEVQRLRGQLQEQKRIHTEHVRRLSDQFQRAYYRVSYERDEYRGEVEDLRYNAQNMSLKQQLRERDIQSEAFNAGGMHALKWSAESQHFNKGYPDSPGRQKKAPKKKAGNSSQQYYASGGRSGGNSSQSYGQSSGNRYDDGYDDEYEEQRGRSQGGRSRHNATSSRSYGNNGPADQDIRSGNYPGERVIHGPGLSQRTMHGPRTESQASTRSRAPQTGGYGGGYGGGQGRRGIGGPRMGERGLITDGDEEDRNGWFQWGYY